jgi:hypothetical protein
VICGFRTRPARWAPLLTVALALAPFNVLAAEPQVPAPTPISSSLMDQASHVAASMSAPALAQAGQGQSARFASSGDRSSWAFFKSPIGIAVIATLVVGASYFVYSTQDDRINSPGRK